MNVVALADARMPLSTLEAPASSADLRAAVDQLWDDIERLGVPSGDKANSVLQVLKSTRRRIYVAVYEGEASDEEGGDPTRMLQFASDAASSIEERCSGCSGHIDDEESDHTSQRDSPISRRLAAQHMTSSAAVATSSAAAATAAVAGPDE